MWRGYDAFCEHIASVAQYLTDALFLVGDEEDYTTPWGNGRTHPVVKHQRTNRFKRALKNVFGR